MNGMKWDGRIRCRVQGPVHLRQGYGGETVQVAGYMVNDTWCRVYRLKYRLPTVDCRLLIADCGLLIANAVLGKMNKENGNREVECKILGTEDRV